jgi:hypothetical protein
MKKMLREVLIDRFFLGFREITLKILRSRLILLSPLLIPIVVVIYIFTLFVILVLLLFVIGIAIPISKLSKARLKHSLVS